MKRTGLILALALFLSSCRGCNKSDAGRLVDLAAPDARVVVSVPSLTETVKGIGAFAQNATKRAGKEALDGARKSLSDQLGFDPFTAKGFATSGIDPAQGIVLFTEGTSEQGVLGVHLDDKAVFEKWIAGLVQRSAGASTVAPQARDGVTFQVASRPFGSESAPTLYWGFVGKDALIAAPEALESFVAALKRNTTRESGAAVAKTPLTGDPTYVALSNKVPTGDLKFFARGEPKPTDGTPHSAGIVGSLSISGTGVTLDSFVDFQVAGLSEALDGEPPLALASKVEEDAVIVALTRIAKPEGLAALRGSPMTKDTIDRSLAGFTRATGLDAEQDLVKLLAGPVTAGVHVMDLAELPSAIARRAPTSALLEFVHVSVTAEVKDREQMITLLDKSKTLVEERGGKINKRTASIAGKEALIYEPDGDKPSLGWGIVDTMYVYGAGRGRIERAIASAVAASPEKSVASKLTGAVPTDLGKARGSLLVVVRAGALADTIAKLQTSQDAMIMAVMPMVSQAIEILRTVGDVGVSTRVEKDGLRIEARQKLQ